MAAIINIFGRLGCKGSESSKILAPMQFYAKNHWGRIQDKYDEYYQVLIDERKATSPTDTKNVNNMSAISSAIKDCWALESEEFKAEIEVARMAASKKSKPSEDEENDGYAPAERTPEEYQAYVLVPAIL